MLWSHDFGVDGCYKAEYELLRSKFSSVIPERNEYIPVFASELNSLFNIAFPNEMDPNSEILVIDTFVNGLRDHYQKKILPRQKENDDSLEKLINLAIKYEALNSILRSKKLSFNFGNNNNTNAIIRNYGKMFYFNPRYPFNSRRYLPYPRFSIPINSNLRPFIFRNNKSNNVRPNNNRFPNYQPRHFGSRPGYQRYSRNNKFTSISAGTNQSSANYFNRNNNSNNYYNSTNKDSKNNFAKKGTSFDNKEFAAQKSKNSINSSNRQHSRIITRLTCKN